MGGEGYTMDDFRAEMHRRGVNKRLRPAPRIPRGRQGGRTKSWEWTRSQILAAARGKLGHLSRFKPVALVPCPWRVAFGECVEPCRCEGKGEVAVGFLIAHYRLMISLYGGKG